MSSIFDENRGVSAGWVLKTVGECELYTCYFEYQGLPCIAVPLYILGQVGMAQGIVGFKDSRPLPPEAGPLGTLAAQASARAVSGSRREPRELRRCSHGRDGQAERFRTAAEP